MKKVKSRAAKDDMRPKYDFSGAVRGKYYERFRQSSNVVLLDPDVSEVFLNAESVNQALRACVCGPQGPARHKTPFESAEAAEQADAAEVRVGQAARRSPLIRVFGRYQDAADSD